MSSTAEQDPSGSETIIAVRRCADWEDPYWDHEPPPSVIHPCPTLRALALPYADHPEFREEWRS